VRDLAIDDERLEEAIVGYVREHPECMDTLEAITHWWVMRRIVRVEVEAVARVVARLTERGVLDVVEIAGERRYRLKGT
jgi:hypothetical protein